MTKRRQEADEYYASVAPADVTADEALVLRQAAAGMLWCKQFYHYDVQRWLDGDPAQPPPPPQRREGRNCGWGHVSNHDVISMPDSWEYPWYASWDLAFHAVALAHLDPNFAKAATAPAGPRMVHAPQWPAPGLRMGLRRRQPARAGVGRHDGLAHRQQARAAQGLAPDNDFLERMFHKLIINFTWWVNRKDAEGNNVFEGGFLGLDNIGLFDRSRPPPVRRGPRAVRRHRLDGHVLHVPAGNGAAPGRHGPHLRRRGHQVLRALTPTSPRPCTTGACGTSDDGFFYDVIRFPDGSSTPVKVRSMVGVVPLLAVTTLHPALAAKLPEFMERAEWFEENRPALAAWTAHTRVPGMSDRRLMSIVGDEGLAEGPAAGPRPRGDAFALRRAQPVPLPPGAPFQPGHRRAARGQIDYEPAESTTELFGGNSNWRGPVWFPLNFMLIEALYRYSRYFDDDLKVEHPVGGGHMATLAEVADDLSRRLVSLFLVGPDGHRPAHGQNRLLQEGARWKDLVWFHEYFHGDTGAGLGASHQTGWTGPGGAPDRRARPSDQRPLGQASRPAVRPRLPTGRWCPGGRQYMRALCTCRRVPWRPTRSLRARRPPARAGGDQSASHSAKCSEH